MTNESQEAASPMWRPHVWRMSELEMITRLIIRALRRDAPNQHTWKRKIAETADRIERGEITIAISGSE